MSENTIYIKKTSMTGEVGGGRGNRRAEKMDFNNKGASHRYYDW